MKILYVAAESSNWVINLCNELAELGNEITCVTQDLDEYDKENPIPVHNNVTRVNLPFSTFVDPNKLVVELDEIMKYNMFDIVFGSHAPVCPAVLVAANKNKTKCGFMLLDIPTDLMEVQEARRKQWDFWFKFLTQADLMITNTHIARDEFTRLTDIELDDSHVITYGTNMPVEFNLFGKTMKQDYVVSVCRLTPVKNCILIPKALNKLKELDLAYIAVGRDSGQLEEIKKYCEENEIRFEHHNMVSESDKFKLISNATALVYPQSTEFIGGLSPFEGMYAGTSVIVPGLKVMLDLYHEHATYFENNSADDLARTIKNATKRIDPGKLVNANEYAKKEASFKTMARKLNIKMKETVRRK